MKSTMFGAIPTTLAVLVVAVGAATAALAVSGDAPAPDDTSIGLPTAEEPVADRAQVETGGWPHDDTDLRTEQHERSSSDDGPLISTTEDRPVRREDRSDEDGLETRVASLQVGTRSYAVSGAGSVTVRREGASLTVVDVDAAPGWNPSIERSSGDDVEVTLRRAGQRIDFSAEIEHDRVKTRVRER